MELPKLVEFLAYLAGPAGSVAVFIYVSDLIRNIREQGGLSEWPSWAVQLLVMGLSLTVPLTALTIVVNVPADTLAQLEEVWAIVGTVALAYITQQGYFHLAKTASNNDAPRG